jgi:hypothetical protein
VTFPGAHHRPVGSEKNFAVIVIARPVMNVDFHEGVVLSESDLRSAIEPLGQVDGITHGNNRPVDLIRPDLEEGQQRLAIDCGNGAVNGVEAVGNLAASNARHVEACIENAPVVLQIDFEVGVEVHRRTGIEATDVGQMPRDIASRKIEGAAERDGDMRKVAADTITTSEDFRGGQVGATGAGNVTDISLHPVADRDDLVDAVDQVPKLLGGKGEEFVRIAVTTREGVAKCGRRDLLNRNGELFEIMIVGPRSDLHQRVMDDDRLARRQSPAMGDVSVGVLKLLRRLLGTKGQTVGQDDLVRIVGTRTNDKKDRCRLGRLVNQATSASWCASIHGVSRQWATRLKQDFGRAVAIRSNLKASSPLTGKPCDPA